MEENKRRRFCRTKEGSSVVGNMRDQKSHNLGRSHRRKERKERQ
jgi:hypothetical protein